MKNKNKMLTKTIDKEKIILSTVLFAFFLFSCYLSSKLNIWEDEVYSLVSSNGNITSTIRQALTFEGQPPVYFVILNLWRQIDQSIFFSRLLSVFSITLAAILMFKLAKIYITKTSSVILVVIFLSNPFIIWASTEIRHYGFSILLSLSLLFFYHKGFLSKEKSKTGKFYYYLTALLSLYTFYYFAFFLFANGIYLLTKRTKEFLYYALIMLVILIPFFLMRKIVIDQLELHNQTLYPPIGIPERLKIIGLGIQNYLFSVHLLPFNKFEKIIFKLIILGVFSYGLVMTILKKSNAEFVKDETTRSLLLSIGVIFLFYILVLKVFPRLYFTDRYLIVVLPLLTILTIKFVSVAFHQPVVKKTVFALILLVFLTGNYFQYKIPIKKYDYKETAGYLENKIIDKRPILFYRGCLSPIFKYYYKGKSELYPLPDSSGYKTDFLANIKSENNLDSILHKFGVSDFCLVADEQIDVKYSVDFNRPMIYNYLKNKSTIEKDTLYYGRAPRYYLRITNFKLNKGN